MIIRTAAATVTGELGEEPFEVLRVLVLPRMRTRCASVGSFLPARAREVDIADPGPCLPTVAAQE
jgi:hypothetical protein